MKKLLAIAVLVSVGTSSTCAGDKPLSRIGFGSCVHQDDPQPVWDAVLAAKPELFLLIGDNIYHDVFRTPESKKESIAQKYAKQLAVPGFAKLRGLCPVLGTWDDHDYGLNDAGAEYPHKKVNQQAFLDFFGVAKDSPLRQQEGVYSAHLFGPMEKRVQVILLDTRYFRSPLKKKAKSGKGEGPYESTSDVGATLLGAAQWQWLEKQLKVPAKVRILASSIQVVAQDHGWEKWMNFPHERERLYKLLRDTQAAGVVCLSGDRHLGELSMMDADIGYPLYDLTASGLSMAFKKWRPQETNRHRVATMNTGNHFGMIQIDWDKKDPLIRLQIRDETGEVTIQEKIALSTLQPGKWKTKASVVAARAKLATGETLTAERLMTLLDKSITIEMKVQATGMAKSGLIFLNSAEDRNSPDNFIIVLDAKAQEALKKAGVDNPRSHFDGKTIRVTGTLSMFREQPQIIVSEAAKIVAVE